MASATAAPGSAAPGTVLEVQGVSMDFGGIRALSRCSFQVEDGQIYAVIGPNGAGKSTLFNVISGVYRSAEGSVRFEGRPLEGLRASRVGQLGLARTFQNIELFAGMTAAENVLVGAHRHLAYGFFRSLAGLPSVRRADRRGREEALAELGFLGVAWAADHRVDDLPYGVQKKVEIARALATRPRLLLLDEPAAGLNDAETAELMEALRRIRGERGITILLVEHNMRFVMGLSDRLCVLNFGQILAEGPPEAVQADPAVIEAYLGDGAC